MKVELPHGPFEKGYQPADAMKMLDEKIKKATKTWEGIDVDRYLAEVRGVDVELRDAAKSLVEAVEGYVCPKKGDKYVFRNEVLTKCNELKKLLKETE